ncbi:MAG TPA: 50S ribosomal protein L24 [Candidatus Dormibacteraeota bacterium]|nr:50S ribosomal protein L24 [Candidatus Dormibacteraeota bacterium]
MSVSAKQSKLAAKPYKIRLKKGDLVIVRAGKHKGQTGKISAVHPRENKVTVDGINIVKKHVKPNREHPQGAIVEVTKPIWVSKVSIVEPTSKKASRVGYMLGVDGKKTRIYKSTGKEIK